MSTFENIRDKAYGTEYHILATRNQCLTVSQPNSDDWSDGIAGKTIINNAAKEPEIIDLGECLNSMGAKIIGHGTNTINIEGVNQLHDSSYAKQSCLSVLVWGIT